MGIPAVVVEDLSFTFRRAPRPALEHISFTHEQGRVLAIIGPAGAGKTTLVRTLNGLVPQFCPGRLEGQVRVFGREVTRVPVHDLTDCVGQVFQDFESQLFCTEVELEVAFGLESLGVDRPTMRQRVRQALEQVGLAGFAHRDPATLSGGEKQRLAIASVLAMRPPLIVLDEAASDLDPIGRRQVLETVAALRRAGLTLILIEHETDDLWSVDQVLLLAGGRVQRLGPAAEVLRETTLLSQHSVRPPQLAELFAAQPDTPPTTVDEALTRVGRLGWRLRPEVVEQFVQADAQRASRYGEPVVEIRALVHRYGPQPAAVDGVDLQIRRGEFVAIVGHNGSGKTTLVKHLNGLLQPTQGVCRVAGRETTAVPLADLAAHVGLVFQDPDHQIFADTVYEEVAFGLRNAGLREPALGQRVREALEAVDLVGHEHDDPFALTKGQRQRLAVASVLAMRPQIIVLDEPTTGLDYGQQRAMMNLLRELAAGGLTVIMVTHTLWLVAEYAHRVIVMAAGRVELDGPTRQVLSQIERLEALSLVVPPVVALSTRLGAPLLSVDEFRRALER